LKLTVNWQSRAHADLEHNRAFGKLVGVMNPFEAAVATQR
jgi:hypothetical protein